MVRGGASPDRPTVRDVKLVGLGGGIGSGKSTVSSMFAERAAVIVDADLIARQVVEPGRPALAALAERFGPGILQGDGTLDRKALAAVAFADAESLAALNAITHPAITAEIVRQVGKNVGSDRIVVLDAALLFETGRVGMVGRMTVDVDLELAVSRLVAQRGFSEDDARARVAAQMSREERRAKADFVIDNSGDLDHLRHEVQRAWGWILGLPDSPTVEEAGGPLGANMRRSSAPVD